MDVFAAIKLYKRYQIAQSISNILLWQTDLKAKDKKLTVNKEFFDGLIFLQFAIRFWSDFEISIVYFLKKIMEILRA